MSTPFNLNLIRTLCAVVDTGSVSKAALQLDVNIAAVSISLNKLREHYHDPLLFRSGAGMKPTALAIDLYKLSQPALEMLLRAELLKSASEKGMNVPKIRIATGPLIELWLMDKLLDNDSDENRMFWDISLYPRSAATRIESLRNKQIDIDIGVGLPHDNALLKFPLIHCDFVCICRMGHPTIGGVISLEEVKNEKIIGYLAKEEILGKEMQHVQIGCSDFPDKLYRASSAVNILLQVSTRDLITFIPSFFSPWLCDKFNLRSVEYAFPILNKFEVFAHIHKSRRNDPHLKTIMDYFHDL